MVMVNQQRKIGYRSASTSTEHPETAVGQSLAGGGGGTSIRSHTFETGSNLTMPVRDSGRSHDRKLPKQNRQLQIRHSWSQAISGVRNRTNTGTKENMRVQVRAGGRVWAATLPDKMISLGIPSCPIASPDPNLAPVNKRAMP